MPRSGEAEELLRAAAGGLRLSLNDHTIALERREVLSHGVVCDAPDNRYRTSPLKGLWTHTQGGFYHDGRFATLGDVVNHYDDAFELALTEQEKGDLVEYL